MGRVLMFPMHKCYKLIYVNGRFSRRFWLAEEMQIPVEKRG